MTVDFDLPEFDSDTPCMECGQPVGDSNYVGFTKKGMSPKCKTCAERPKIFSEKKIDENGEEYFEELKQ